LLGRYAGSEKNNQALKKGSMLFQKATPLTE